MTQPSQVKIALEGPHGDVETLWANTLGRDLYELDNLPWYAYNVSAGDVIEARHAESGELRMIRVVRKSGNRTIRILLELTPDGAHTFEAEQVLAGIRERGCSYEGMNSVLVAINIPPSVNLSSFAEYLSETPFEWEYADPTYEDLFPGVSGEIDVADV